MKDFHVVGKNMTRYARKVAIYIVRFFMDQTLACQRRKQMHLTLEANTEVAQDVKIWMF